MGDNGRNEPSSERTPADQQPQVRLAVQASDSAQGSTSTMQRSSLSTTSLNNDILNALARQVAGIHAAPGIFLPQSQQDQPNNSLASFLLNASLSQQSITPVILPLHGVTPRLAYDRAPLPEWIQQHAPNNTTSVAAASFNADVLNALQMQALASASASQSGVSHSSQVSNHFSLLLNQQPQQPSVNDILLAALLAATITPLQQQTLSSFQQQTLPSLQQQTLSSLQRQTLPSLQQQVPAPLSNEPIDQTLATHVSSISRNDAKAEQGSGISGSPVGQLSDQPPNLVPTNRPPIPLAIDSDEQHLSPYQYLLRKQIELFETAEGDIKGKAQGRNIPIIVGQVGVRCRHCASRPSEGRLSGAVFYSQTLGGIYQISQNMCKNHFLNNRCRSTPEDIKKKLMSLRNSNSRGSGGKQYWSDAAHSLGVLEEGNVLRFTQLKSKNTTTSKNEV